MRFLGTVAGVAALLTMPLYAQGPTARLEIVLENTVQYFDDLADPSKMGTSAEMVMPVRIPAFTRSIGVGDIVSINGKPARGTYVYRTDGLRLSPTPAKGLDMIADIARGGAINWSFDILQPDLTFVGTIIGSGLNGTTLGPPAGAAGNTAVLGGTGAFLGARGQMTWVPPSLPTNLRYVSMETDPSTSGVTQNWP
jgi:hypothetical protein